MTDAVSASDLVGRRVQEIRKRRGWTAAQLAERCAAIGAEQITESVLANIETGRRTAGKRRREVTIDEVLILAAALNAPPVLLFTPVGIDQALQVSSTVTLDAGSALRWVSGEDTRPTSGEMLTIGDELRQWHEVAAPVTLVRAFHSALARRYRAGSDDAGTLSELADTVNRLIEAGIPIPASLSDDLVVKMRRQGLLRYPNAVGGDDGSR